MTNHKSVGFRFFSANIFTTCGRSLVIGSQRSASNAARPCWHWHYTTSSPGLTIALILAQVHRQRGQASVRGFKRGRDLTARWKLWINTGVNQKYTNCRTDPPVPSSRKFIPNATKKPGVIYTPCDQAEGTRAHRSIHVYRKYFLTFLGEWYKSCIAGVLSGIRSRTGGI